MWDSNIRNSAAIAMDLNLPAHSIEWIFHQITQIQETHRPSIWVEPTSVPKISKIASPDILKHIDVLTPNLHELFALSHALAQQNTDKFFLGNFPREPPPLLTLCNGTLSANSTLLVGAVNPAVRMLLEMGVGAVIVKLGPCGVVLGERVANQSTHLHHFEALPVCKVVNVTGAGDSLFAATLWSHFKRQQPLIKAIHVGLIAAKYSVESLDTIPPTITHLLVE